MSHCRHEKCYDEDVVPLLENDLKSYDSGYRFVVLHLGGGSHGPHTAIDIRRSSCASSPPATTPTLPTSARSSRSTTRTTTPFFTLIMSWRKLSQTLERRGAPYVLIYVSDHGESLMENGVMFHGMPPGMALPAEQAEIPLIVKSSVPITIDPRVEYQQWTCSIRSWTCSPSRPTCSTGTAASSREAPRMQSWTSRLQEWPEAGLLVPLRLPAFLRPPESIPSACVEPHGLECFAASQIH